MADEVFTGRVSRFLLFFLADLGLLFVLAGCFLIPTIWGALLFWLLGGIVALQCGWYFLFPPVMLKFTPAGVSFGTGFRYKPFFIPWRQVVAVGYGVNPSLTGWREKFAGASMTMADTPEIPACLITSAGISYAFRRLTIHWLYASHFPWTIVREGRHFLEENKRTN